jgi:hypothetical protein
MSRFLNFGTDGTNSQKLFEPLTQRRFRACWEQTSSMSEGPRFREVL